MDQITKEQRRQGRKDREMIEALRRIQEDLQCKSSAGIAFAKKVKEARDFLRWLDQQELLEAIVAESAYMQFTISMESIEQSYMTGELNEHSRRRALLLIEDFEQKE